MIRAAEGNPLFVEQLVSMLVDEGTLRRVEGDWRLADEVGEIPVPPTIQALLAARLDRLGREERAVVEPASVIGLMFQESAVRWLAPEAVQVTMPEHLSALDRKQLVHPTAPAADDDATFRFHHILIRDAAYGGQLKRARAASTSGSSSGPTRSTPTATGRSSSRRSSATTSSRRIATWPSSDRSTSTGSSSGSGPPSGSRPPAAGRSPAATCRPPRTSSGAPRRTCPAGDPLRPVLLIEAGEALTNAGELAAADEVLEAAQTRGGRARATPPRGDRAGSA